MSYLNHFLRCFVLWMTFLSGQNPYKTPYVYVIKTFVVFYFPLKSTEILTVFENCFLLVSFS